MTIWMANAELGMFVTSLSRDRAPTELVLKDGTVVPNSASSPYRDYLSWLDFATEHIDRYIDANLINGPDAAAHKALLGRFRDCAEHFADWSLLQPPASDLPIPRVYRRVIGLIGKGPRAR